MKGEREPTAKELEEAAIDIVKKAGGYMSFEDYDTELEQIGFENPQFQREWLIQNNKLETMGDRDFIRVPIELPRREE